MQEPVAWSEQLQEPEIAQGFQQAIIIQPASNKGHHSRVASLAEPLGNQPPDPDNQTPNPGNQLPNPGNQPPNPDNGGKQDF